MDAIYQTFPVPSNNTICAELTGSDTATALGIRGRGNAPILDLCRKLVEAGVDPNLPLDGYRGGTSCLHIRAIGEAAGLRVNARGTGFIKAAPAVPIASPMLWNGGSYG